jgi:drug/metabolite transporter (DMT)-like permease
MLYLTLVSLLWAFSFGLIRRYLGNLDSSAVALLRLLLSLLVFLPWLRPQGLSGRLRLQLLAIGALQFGLMYVLYLAAFHSLKAYQIALLTLLTPIFISLFDHLLVRRWSWVPWACALLAVLGALIVLAERPLGRAQWWGILLIQASNACFALGQVLYRHARAAHPTAYDRQWFAWLYLGAVLMALPFAAGATVTTLQLLSPKQALVLAYLGLIASGVGFFLWNRGATQVKTATLAVMNNAKIPLGVAVSLLIFAERANLVRLLLGSALMVLALVLAERTRVPAPKTSAAIQRDPAS